MANAVKVTVSLPEDLHRAVERRRRARKQSRSQFFRNAVLSVLRAEDEREAADRYVEGYRKRPEKQLEVSTIDRLGRAVLASEPW
jgi:metal-responsive CopG/Arc/MetJ family transcriptional regulator